MVGKLRGSILDVDDGFIRQQMLPVKLHVLSSAVKKKIAGPKIDCLQAAARP